MMTPKATKIPVEGPQTDQVDEPSAEDAPSQGEGAGAMEDLRQQAEEYKDRWLRAAAEVENVRKRAHRRAQDQVDAERERLLRAILTVVDNLERALDSGAEDEGLRDGVALTHRELLHFLAREGVSPMQDVVGQPFDPLYHEAMATVSMPEQEGKVVEEVQKGYLLDGRPLRPARVVVARADA